MLESALLNECGRVVHQCDRNSLPSTHRGGADCWTSEMHAGDASGRMVHFQRRTSRNPRAWGAPGL